MKQLKIACILSGILCSFILNGCIEGSSVGNGSGGKTLSLGNKENNTPTLGENPNNGNNRPGLGTINNTLQNQSKDVSPIITSLTLWINKDDANTASAGEIIGNNITVQVPAETDLTAPLFITYTGKGYVELRTDSGTLIQNNTQQYFSESQIFLGLKNGKAQVYNVSVIKRSPYFTYFDTDHDCLKDLDGNIWASEYFHQDTWQNLYNVITAVFFACNIPVKSWNLPSRVQAKAFADKLPIAYRAAPDGPGSLEPTVWFNDSAGFNFQRDSSNFWTLDEDKDIPGNAYVIDISKQKTGIYSDSKESYAYSALPVSNGDGSSAKTITNLTLTPESGTPVKATIAGNQIFVTTSVWGNPGQDINATITASTTGGTLSYNGTPLSTTNSKYPVSQPIPITVTAKNGDKNIYALIVKAIAPTPPPKPGVYGLITVCTSLSGTIDPHNQFNRIIATTIGNNFYQNYLPLPGTCSQLNIGNTKIQDLADHNVMWYSFSNETPIGSTKYVDSTGYYHDIILKFKWVPTNGLDPSGFDLSVSIDPDCHHDSQYADGITPKCKQ